MKHINILFQMTIISVLSLLLFNCSENEFNPYIGEGKDDKQTNAVFIGNSITANWYKLHASFFTDNNYLNKGVGGETTTDFLVRFNSVLTETKPKCVVIMGGINDMITNNGNSYEENKTFGNIKSMVEIAKEKQITVVLCSVLPIRYNNRHPDTRERIMSLNALIKKYAEENNCIFTDYYSHLADEDGAIRLTYTYDNLHLTEDGYLVMEPIIKGVIDNIIK